MKKIAVLFLIAAAAAFAACAYAADGKRLGALSPEEALTYMEKTENLLIVDVAAKRWYDEKHFESAVNIPIEELDDAEEEALYKSLPSGRPVIMHCRLGMIVPGAYEKLSALRPDIPEISYIDGAPLFDEYNARRAGESR